MSIGREEFEKLAALSGLEFSEEETEDCIKELTEIMDMADIINRSVYGGNSDIKNVGAKEISCGELREDTVFPSLPNEKLLSNAEGERGCFAVKKMIEKQGKEPQAKNEDRDEG